MQSQREILLKENLQSIYIKSLWTHHCNAITTKQPVIRKCTDGSHWHGGSGVPPQMAGLGPCTFNSHSAAHRLQSQQSWWLAGGVSRRTARLVCVGRAVSGWAEPHDFPRWVSSFTYKSLTNKRRARGERRNMEGWERKQKQDYHNGRECAGWSRTITLLSLNFGPCCLFHCNFIGQTAEGWLGFFLVWEWLIYLFI